MRAYVWPREGDSGDAPVSAALESSPNVSRVIHTISCVKFAPNNQNVVDENPQLEHHISWRLCPRSLHHGHEGTEGAVLGTDFRFKQPNTLTRNGCCRSGAPNSLFFKDCVAATKIRVSGIPPSASE